MATTLLSLSRFSVGAFSLIFPATACTTFLLPPPGSHTTIARLFGARDAVLGAYLWYASRASPEAASSTSSAKTGEIKREKRKWRLKEALLLGAVIDSLDVISSTACVLEGNLEPGQWPLIGGGAALFVFLAWLGWPEDSVAE
jgi:Ca2+/Na+ antiporter